MKSQKRNAIVAASFVTALFVSVSFTDGGPSVSVLGDEVCADTNVCHQQCDTLVDQCIQNVRKATKVGTCMECCKKTEYDGRLPLNPHPTHHELHQFMLDKCVFGGLEGEVLSRGFPHELDAALAYQPKGKIAEKIRERFDSGARSEPTDKGPKSANESACMKGCTFRPRAGIETCHQVQNLCLLKCPAPTGGSRCGK